MGDSQQILHHQEGNEMTMEEFPLECEIMMDKDELKRKEYPNSEEFKLIKGPDKKMKLNS